jgi:hypothetical protein
MSSVIPLLSDVKVAAPCFASWQDMEAVDGDRVHFCAGCKKNVYNLSAMSQTQAEGLLRKHEGHLCVRYYKRTDGTILTQNCPVGQAALRMQMIARSKRVALATAALIAITALGEMQPGYRRTAVTGQYYSPPTIFEELADSVQQELESIKKRRVTATPQQQQTFPLMGSLDSSAVDRRK